MQTYWIRVSGHGVWASVFHSSTQWVHRVAVKQGIFRAGWHHRDGMTEPAGMSRQIVQVDLNGRGASPLRELEGACP